MNIVHQWKRFLAVGCSHGILSDPNAIDAVLKFRDAWKPDTVLHLGDAYDTTAFMKDGKAAESGGDKPIKEDMDAGTKFLNDLRPSVFMCGNHEDRLWRLRGDKNDMVAHTAQELVEKITNLLGAWNCPVIPWGYKQAYRLGNFALCHGTIFSESCARDMAEVHGNVIFAHAHRAAQSTGRRTDCPVGICVGHLMQEGLAEYAKARKSTYAWSRGFCWGVYRDDRLVPWLHIQPQSQSEWILPI